MEPTKVDRRRTVRYFRITFSAVCLLACALLIVFCARSSHLNEHIGWQMTNGRSIGIHSLLGRLRVATWKQQAETGSWRISIDSEQFANDVSKWKLHDENAFGFGIKHLQTNEEVIIPYWFLVLLTAALAAASWIRWRFSLRTLLIAVTLLAVILGFLTAMI